MKSLSEHIESKNELSTADIALYVVDSLKHKDMTPAIQNSFAHVGIQPVDRSKILEMIKNEKPDEMLLRDKALQVAVTLANEKLESLENLSGQKRKRDEEDKARRVRSKGIIDNSMAIVLTDPSSVVALQMKKSMSELKKLSATDLHVEMIRNGWTIDSIKRPNGHGFLSKVDLLKKVSDQFEEDRKKHEANLQLELEKKLVRAPALQLLNHSATQTEMSPAVQVEQRPSLQVPGPHNLVPSATHQMSTEIEQEPAQQSPSTADVLRPPREKENPICVGKRRRRPSAKMRELQECA